MYTDSRLTTNLEHTTRDRLKTSLLITVGGCTSQARSGTCPLNCRTWFSNEWHTKGAKRIRVDVLFVSATTWSMYRLSVRRKENRREPTQSATWPKLRCPMNSKIVVHIMRAIAHRIQARQADTSLLHLLLVDVSDWRIATSVAIGRQYIRIIDVFLLWNTAQILHSRFYSCSNDLMANDENNDPFAWLALTYLSPAISRSRILADEEHANGILLLYQTRSLNC